MQCSTGKKGHHKKGQYDDEHKGHKGIVDSNIFREYVELIVALHILGKKGHDKHYEHDDSYHKKGGKKGGHKKGYEKKGGGH